MSEEINIELHMLAPVDAVNSTRIRELAGDISLSEGQPTQLMAYRAVCGERSFHVGFGIGNETGVSAIGRAVLERLALEMNEPAECHVVVISGNPLTAWNRVRRRLLEYTGKLLMFVFPDSELYDAGHAPVRYEGSGVDLFHPNGNKVAPLSREQVKKVKKQAALLRRSPHGHA